MLASETQPEKKELLRTKQTKLPTQGGWKLLDPSSKAVGVSSKVSKKMATFHPKEGKLRLASKALQPS